MIYSEAVRTCQLLRLKTKRKTDMWLKTVIILIGLICSTNGVDDKARYDNHRIYRVHLKTDDQVKVFQEIEQRSDSYQFMGHAREANQNLSFLVAAHKIADLTDILTDYKIGYEILVS